MKRSVSIFSASLIALLPLADLAEAKDKGKGKFKYKSKNGHAELSIKVKPGKVKVKSKGVGYHGHCPPGLAKKNLPCVPPGLARTAPGLRDRDRDHYDRDRYDDHYRYDDHDYDHDAFYGDRRYDRDRFLDGYSGRELTRITTFDGDVIHLGDVIVDPVDRYPVLDADIFGLPPIADDQYYLRTGDAAVLLDSDTRRVMRILALADLLID